MASRPDAHGDVPQWTGLKWGDFPQHVGIGPHLRNLSAAHTLGRLYGSRRLQVNDTTPGAAGAMAISSYTTKHVAGRPHTQTVGPVLGGQPWACCPGPALLPHRAPFLTEMPLHKPFVSDN